MKLLFLDSFCLTQTTRFVWQSENLSTKLATRTEELNNTITKTGEALTKLSSAIELNNNEKMQTFFAEVKKDIYEVIATTKTPEQEKIVLDFVTKVLQSVGIQNPTPLDINTILQSLGLHAANLAENSGSDTDTDLTESDVTDKTLLQTIKNTPPKTESPPANNSNPTTAPGSNTEAAPYTAGIAAATTRITTKLNQLVSTGLLTLDPTTQTYAPSGNFESWKAQATASANGNPDQIENINRHATVFNLLFGATSTDLPTLNAIATDADAWIKTQSDKEAAVAKLTNDNGVVTLLESFLPRSAADLLKDPTDLAQDQTEPAENALNEVAGTEAKNIKNRQENFKDLMKYFSIGTVIDATLSDSDQTDKIETVITEGLSNDIDAWTQTQKNLLANKKSDEAQTKFIEKVGKNPNFTPRLKLYLEKFDPSGETKKNILELITHDNPTESQGNIKDIIAKTLQFETLVGINYAEDFRKISTSDLSSQYDQLNTLEKGSPEYQAALDKFKADKNAISWMFEMSYSKGLDGANAKLFVDQILSQGFSIKELQNPSKETKALIQAELNNYIDSTFDGFEKMGVQFSGIFRQISGAFGGFLKMFGIGGDLGNQKKDFYGEIGGFMEPNAENNTGIDPKPVIPETDPTATELNRDTAAALDGFLALDANDASYSDQLTNLVTKYTALTNDTLKQKFWNPTPPTGLAAEPFQTNRKNLREAILNKIAADNSATDKLATFNDTRLASRFTDLDLNAQKLDTLPANIVNDLFVSPKIDLTTTGNGDIIKEFLGQQAPGAAISISTWNNLSEQLVGLSKNKSITDFELKIGAEGRLEAHGIIPNKDDKDKTIAINETLILDTWAEQGENEKNGINEFIAAIEKLGLKTEESMLDNEGEEEEEEEAKPETDYDGETTVLDSDGKIKAQYKNQENLTLRQETLEAKTERTPAEDKELAAIETALKDPNLTATAAESPSDEATEMSAGLKALSEKPGALDPFTEAEKTEMRAMKQTDQLQNVTGTKKARIEYVMTKAETMSVDKLTPDEKVDYDFVKSLENKVVTPPGTDPNNPPTPINETISGIETTIDNNIVGGIIKEHPKKVLATSVLAGVAFSNFWNPLGWTALVGLGSYAAYKAYKLHKSSNENAPTPDPSAANNPAQADA